MRTAWRIFSALLPSIFSGLVLASCWYILKEMIRAQPPEIGVGVIGGMVWCFVTSKVWQLFKWTLEDAKETLITKDSK